VARGLDHLSKGTYPRTYGRAQHMAELEAPQSRADVRRHDLSEDPPSGRLILLKRILGNLKSRGLGLLDRSGLA
jgi:hypothetical protein